MIIQTHKILSAIIYDKVRENFNFHLEYNQFLLGNVLPDISPGLILKSHYKAESLGFVTNEIVKLSKTPSALFQSKQTRKNFSRNIGIVSHFLCDFLCVPHFNRWHYHSPMMLSHIKYEKSLNLIAIKNQTIPNLSLQPIGNLENNTLESFIEAVLNEYSRKEDYRNDLIYASNVCAKVIEAITCVIFNEKKAQPYVQIA